MKNKDNENYNRKQSNIDLIIRSGEKKIIWFFQQKQYILNYFL